MPDATLERLIMPTKYTHSVWRIRRFRRIRRSVHNA
ncbi:mannitol-1-phosphate 5-dehydrogenase [Escherichia coli]|nr:mannitol-1-phosphate 5-dehydrogenase [Escherichia coli E1520]EGB56201.1 mannitol-1-phosphate 5-dehydrogenase [Escherichia coli H489]EGB66710.1 mannitol-1-phosphate 5-dehydrogenase [Escherichia coli TA007]OKS97405.1 mannitol-1-phosphate 5-dehydrogenase [Escherichia coli]OOC67808.1 mannitol-1-phosphate 5-dehydrogenase [Escherichia coli ATCC 8739]